MLIDFLSSCTTVLNEETPDFNNVIASLSRTSVSIGLMPAITDDLFPIYSLVCTSANNFVSPDVYIVPAGAHDYWAIPCFEDMVNKFYQEDHFREQFQIELEEMILLKQPDISASFCFNKDILYNVLYCRLTMPNNLPVHLLIIPSDPAGCWEIIERYGLNCDILIDSHKGLGNWFEEIPLYRLMRETKHTELLPRYYFKGLYISHEAPKGFKLIYTIPEPVSVNGRIAGDWEKEIYEIDWDENRKY